MKKNAWIVIVALLSVIAGLTAGYVAHSYMIYSAKKKIDHFTQTVMKNNKVSYEIESVNPFSKSIILSNVVITNPQAGIPVRADQVLIDRFDYKHEPPRFADFSINGIHIPLNIIKSLISINLDSSMSSASGSLSLNDLPRECDAFNSDEILMDVTMNYTYKDLTQKLNIQHMSLSLRDISSMDMMLVMSGLPLIPSATTPVDPSRVILHSFKLAITDKSARNCIISLVSKTRKVPKKDLMREAWESLQASSMSKDTIRSMYAFISGESKGIMLEYAPQNPMNFVELFQTLQDPNRIKTLPVSFSNF